MMDMYEPIPLDDIFCTHLVKVQRVGPCVRLVFGVSESDTDSGEVFRANAKLMLPADALEAVARAILAAPPEPKQPPKKPDLHLVN